jgi:hypothetical protein
MVHIILFEKIYGFKKFGNCIHIYYKLLFVNYLSVKTFHVLVLPQIFLQLINGLHQHLFSIQLSHYSWNMKLDLSLALVFVPTMHDLLVYCNTTYDMTYGTLTSTFDSSLTQKIVQVEFFFSMGCSLIFLFMHFFQNGLHCIPNF